MPTWCSPELYKTVLRMLTGQCSYIFGVGSGTNLIFLRKTAFERQLPPAVLRTGTHATAHPTFISAAGLSVG